MVCGSIRDLFLLVTNDRNQFSFLNTNTIYFEGLLLKSTIGGACEPSSEDSQTLGMVFLLLSASETTESSKDHFKLQTKVIFSTRVKTERAETRDQRRQTEAFLNNFLSGDPSLLSNNTCFWQFSSGDFKNINCLFPQYLLFPLLIGGSPVEAEDKREILHKQTAEWELRGQGTGGQISNSRQNTAAAHCSHHEHYDCSGLESAMLGNVSLTE